MNEIITDVNKKRHFCGSIFNEYIVLDEKYGAEIYQDLIYKITRMYMTAEAAKEIWVNIIRHIQNLSSKLDRNVGVHVAACDYFLTDRVVVKHPILIEECLLRNKEEGAFRDALTGLFNRRYFNQELPRQVEGFRRCGMPFSLLMLDVDHFKRVNDQYGHMAGDAALKTVAEIITRIARSSDTAVRYGGEEFAVILPGTGREEAVAVAERIREAMERRSIVHDGGQAVHITLSAGVVTYPWDAPDRTDLVRKADQALYLAKCTRNRVVAYSAATPNYRARPRANERLSCHASEDHPA